MAPARVEARHGERLTFDLRWALTAGGALGVPHWNAKLRCLIRTSAVLFPANRREVRNRFCVAMETKILLVLLAFGSGAASSS